MKTQIQFVNKDAKKLYKGKVEYKTEKSEALKVIDCKEIFEEYIKTNE